MIIHVVLSMSSHPRCELNALFGIINPSIAIHPQQNFASEKQK